MRGVQHGRLGANVRKPRLAEHYYRWYLVEGRSSRGIERGNDSASFVRLGKVWVSATNKQGVHPSLHLVYHVALVPLSVSVSVLRYALGHY